MTHLAVKNFEKLQHYKKRGPLWIKLYAAILHDPAFIRLSEVAQAQLIKLWVLASQAGNPLPNDSKFLARGIGTDRLQLHALIDSGFLIPCYQNASNEAIAVIAERSQNASNGIAAPCAREEGETERETERETEKISSSSARDGPDVAAQLPTDTDRAALTALLGKVPSPVVWIAEMRACLAAMPGHVAVTPAQLGEAVRDFVANNGQPPNMRLFRRYLESATRAPRESNGDDPFLAWGKREAAKEQRHAS